MLLQWPRKTPGWAWTSALAGHLSEGRALVQQPKMQRRDKLGRLLYVRKYGDSVQLPQGMQLAMRMQCRSACGQCLRGTLAAKSMVRTALAMVKCCHSTPPMALELSGAVTFTCSQLCETGCLLQGIHQVHLLH